MTHPDPTEPQATSAEATSAQPQELEVQLKQAREEHLRLLAELDNQRKRLQRDAESARKFGLERLMSELIPVVDSLEAGLKAPGADAVKLREGMELTLRLLLKALEGGGLQALDPVGRPFNPELHQAMSLVEARDAAPGSVVTVFQKGYQLHERLLRPAMVAVAREGAGVDEHA